MAARAIWKAAIDLGGRNLPVKLYSAVEDTKVRFRLLHRADMAPVRQQMVDALSGEPVPREAQRKGIALGNDEYVLLSDAELASLEPSPSRNITAVQALAADDLDLRWLDRPYYLGPDGDAGAYFALAAALEARRLLLVARWTMRKRNYAGAIHARAGYLLLETMHRAGELVALDALEPPASREPSARERKLAEQLISALEGDFDPAEYRDEYSQALRAMLQQKASGKVVRFPAAERRHRSESLVAALEASLAGQRSRASGG
jgi:DNA end-binding protein Ku